MRGAYRRFAIAAILVAGALMLASPATAQMGRGFGGPGSGFMQGASESVVTVSGQFTAPDRGKPGYLFLTAQIKPNWHIYSITQGEGGPVQTKINLKPSDRYRVVGAFQATSVPEKKREAAFGGIMVETHAGSVTWFAPVEFARGVDPASVKIEGEVFAQPCDSNSCLAPQNFPFTASLGPGLDLTALAGPAKPAAVAATSQSSMPLLAAIVTGFLGGLILNIMPCVLPVIGLKIFSFIEQSGHSRRQAFMLNLWFSIGLLAVFMLLGTLAAVWGFGWGQLFHYRGFNIGLAAVVFVMGLSFLGVWEIPIPGFVGGRGANELMAKEGAVGALAKGVLTTLLATPCSAPFLGTALAFSAVQPPAITYAIFLAIGLGMASPYLLIGAFPELIRFLPRPGAWMETFKQVMGFVLLGTVVFLLSFIEQAYVVRTVGLLFALWAACWWIGRTPLTAELGEKLRAWAGGVAFAGLVGILLFGGWFQGDQLAWKPFDQKTFEELTKSDKTVMVDFTADWCLTCKTMEALVLNTSEIREAVDANKVVVLKADWTHRDQEVTDMLERLGSKQVPVLAIFPAGHADHPVVLRGGYTKQTVLEALAKAGPSQGAAGPQAAGLLPVGKAERPW